MYGSQNLGIFPGLATIGGYFHSTNGTAAGPSQARDLVKSGSGELLSPRRKGDDRFRPPLKGHRGNFRIIRDVPVVVIGHAISVHYLDSPQPLSVIHTFKTGNHEPQWETLLRAQRLAILTVADNTVVHGFR